MESSERVELGRLNAEGQELITIEEDARNEELNSFLTTSGSGENSISSSTPFQNITGKYNEFNFILANARSLPSKMNSLIDCFNELDLHCALLCETWFKTSKASVAELKEVENGEQVALICKNRPRKRGGGVAIAYNQAKMTMKRFSIPNNKYEMMCGS